jgi:serine-type D-Ala-D-Ala carboxypeptidase/endopeptidase (penicillin-binding protein 4)
VTASSRLRTLLLALVVGVLSTSAPALAADGPPSATAGTVGRPSSPLSRAAGQALARRLDAVLATAGAGTVAAAVEVDGHGHVYGRNASLAVPPASTQKSFTALAALLALGPDARLRTEVAATSTPVGGQLRGGLWLVGGGDPYLTTARLTALAADVRAAGITTVAGDLLLDDRRFDARRRADGWKASFVPGQSGPLSALALDGNTWRRDAAFLADPALPAAVRFRDLLRAAGVTVTGTVRRAPRPAGARVVAASASAPVSAVVRQVLKTSDNFAAEVLLKELGRTVRADGSSASGVAAVRQVLGRVGVPVGAGADGSGLSSLDRQSPAGQLALLRAAGRSGVGAAFRAALPVGCVDGTLRSRFCGTAAAGRVHAKTGTLSGVRTLAGETTTASGRRVRFAFQLSGVGDAAQALRAVDGAVVLLAASRI